MSYARTPYQRGADLSRARTVEARVAEWLGNWMIDRSASTDALDFWLPGVYVESKGKYQPVGERWPIPAGCAREDAFIIDELSIRKAAAHYPHAYIVFSDEVLDRTFVARVDEVFCADRCRVNRVGSTGVAKGKWVLDLTAFTPLLDPANELLEYLMADQVATPWKESACLGRNPVEEV